jgi:hypothetical protein
MKHKHPPKSKLVDDDNGWNREQHPDLNGNEKLQVPE